MSFTTLISTAELAERLGDPGLRVIDCRHQLADVGYGERVYGEAHIPGAYFLHLDRDLSGPLNGRNGRHPLPDPQALAARFAALGIGAGTQVVAYDDVSGFIAGRLWWLLNWLGHDQVALLDGGIKQWVKEGRPLSAEVPAQPAPAAFEARLRDGVVDADDVLGALGRPGVRVVDARPPDRFRGENETLDPVGGHVPGAISRFCKNNLGDDGRFKPAAQLRSEFLDILNGAEPDAAIMMCGSGVTACHNLLAMRIAGLPGARFYAGSWSQWCSDPARPVER